MIIQIFAGILVTLVILASLAGICGVMLSSRIDRQQEPFEGEAKA